MGFCVCFEFDYTSQREKTKRHRDLEWRENKQTSKEKKRQEYCFFFVLFVLLLFFSIQMSFCCDSFLLWWESIGLCGFKVHRSSPIPLVSTYSYICNIYINMYIARENGVCFWVRFQWRNLITLMILPQVHLRKPCYDFSFL